MAVKWTEEQQKVIDTRDHNILVSAAAGSGKTAVLVARILALVTDKQQPVDIDRLLVVTFTNAAAAEMRERIRDALTQRAEEEPDDTHLQRQLVLVHNAKITTIHSFCLQVLRNHFQLAGIDPSFRVADQGEVLLLEQECVKEVVAEAYESISRNTEFETFLEMLATGKNDTVIEELILSLYHFALGQPWPHVWLARCRDMYHEWGCAKSEDDETEAELCSEGAAEPEWLSYIVQDTRQLLLDVREQIEEAIAIAGEPDGPYLYLPALEDDLAITDRLLQSEDYASFAEAFRNMGSYTALSRKRDDSISPAKKQRVQDMRQSVKDAIAGIRTHYFYNKTDILQKELCESGLIVRVLTRLTEQFMERIAVKKAEKNLLDFGDLEHLTLKVLVENNNTESSLSEQDLFVPTQAAQEYAEQFEEIMIDEYQDSNLVQEMILASVAGRGKKEPNRFMVGDVKQSIYRFRLARPELFMEKYKTYRQGKKEDCRIDLHKNFRSRVEVLEGTNYIFRQIMTENPGGVVYDKDAALYPGADFPPRYPESEEEADKAETGQTEVCAVRAMERNASAPELLLLEAGSQDRIKSEARMVGSRIREITGKELVWDKELEKYRPAKYSDIVILLRTVSGWAETFTEVLGDMGIPCVAGSQTGYFSATEVRVVLSYLQILDNPMQDIPLAAVLRSAIGGFSDDELARIRIGTRKRSFYECCQEYMDENEENLTEDTNEILLQHRQERDAGLQEKLRRFFEVFSSLRSKCGHTPVHMLLWEILERTGYGMYAAALPAGSQRKANLDMLVEKAIAYEATSYRGLYHFVRYIENLKKYDMDFGEANIGSEADNTVRLLSIHKSKGLEFPIVFVSGMGKQFNESDIRSRVVMHPDFGIGCDFVDTENRTRQATLLKKMIQQKSSQENLGEELRVLYVAMTRAKEKLILTGSTRDVVSKLMKWNAQAWHKGEQLSYSCLSQASTYLDWVMPALLRHPAAEELLGKHELVRNHIFEAFPAFELRLIRREELNAEEEEGRSREALDLQTLLHMDPAYCYDRETREYLNKVFASVYPYEADGEITGKLSVSELKKMSQVTEETDDVELYQEETVVPLIPQFRGMTEEIVGAARGTVYHTFMENLDFSRKDGLELQLEELISCGKMSREEGGVLCLSDIRRFLASGTGQEMEEAALAGRLYRERPFVIGVAANEIRSEWNKEQTVLVQGIIDAYFHGKDGSIVLLDYKTDHVRTAQELVEKYRAQLDYYAEALTRLTGCEVREKVIWSFHLGREIRL